MKKKEEKTTAKQNCVHGKKLWWKCDGLKLDGECVCLCVSVVK